MRSGSCQRGPAVLLAWSEEATSEPFDLSSVEDVRWRFGLGAWVGGDWIDGPSLGGAVVSDESSGVWFWNPSPRDGVTVATDSLYVDLGHLRVWGEGIPGDGVLTVTGNGEAFSYSSEATGELLGALAGASLYFQHNYGGGRVSNIGPAAGTVVVVPEPSAVALIFGAAVLVAAGARRIRREKRG